MQAIIPGKSVKLFSRIIRCLAKVGEELFLEAYEDKLLLKTLNAACSAFCSFHIVPAFFESYRLEGRSCRVKCLLKLCTSAFKNMQNLEKCTVLICESDPCIIFEMHCKLQIKKTFKFNLEEGNPVSASYNKEACTSRLIAHPKLFEECVANFASNIEELSLTLCRETVRLKSVVPEKVDSANDPIKKHLVTELTLSTNDFERYRLSANVDTLELILGLRELKAILSFCEVMMQPIQMYMAAPGDPLIISTKAYSLFEADFIIATLQGSSTSQTPHTQQDPSVSSKLEPEHKSRTFRDHFDDSRSISQNCESTDNPYTAYHSGVSANSGLHSPHGLSSPDLDEDLVWTSDLNRTMNSDEAHDSDEVNSDSDSSK
ncbi:cell cycle checkpoint control protein RAD9A-like [Schistocerca gregaria]|uniref:cell cycle checkpoint control protein RAD9A-like n=1 Tax=Schistocerca gregaria TaxID=7010 RepID=UPI00211E38F8|nr:cell cycle checkpoint control protein RAD9A-like [Schistocerca gregaria]